jgi:hypothetical protein
MPADIGSRRLEMFQNLPSLASDHLEQLYAEAESERLLRLGRSDARVVANPWRRALGRGARGLSAVLEGASVRLDPTIDRTPLGA